MKNVLELVRVSTESQAGEDRAGIPAQKAINRRTAKIHGLNIVRTIEIVDVSGAHVLQSPGMQELLRLIESPDIYGVVCKEFSRLIRPDKLGDYELLQNFIDTQTLLYLPDGPIDLATKGGQLLGTIRAAIAGHERREIIERMMDAKEIHRQEGKNPCGPVALPYGVGYSKERGWRYLPESEKVKKAFSMFLSGEPYLEIARRFDFARSTVRYLLQNPIYKGLRVYDKKHDLSPSGYVPRPGGRQGYRRKIKRSPDEIIRVKVLDGIISEEDFSRVQEMVELKRQKRWRARAKTPGRYTYNGFLACGDCSSLVYTHSSKQDFYVCKSHHPREREKRAEKGLSPCTNRHMLRKQLEPKIDCLLGAKLREQDFLRRLVDEYNDRLETHRPQVGTDERAIAAKLNALSEKRQRVLEAFFDGMIGKEERDDRVKSIDREVSVYENILMECSPQIETRPALDLHGVMAVVEPFAEWEFLDREDKRAMLRILCPEISVQDYVIKGLTWNFGAKENGSYKDSYPKRAGSRSPGPPSA